jgi:hypothetical protein
MPRPCALSSVPSQCKYQCGSAAANDSASPTSARTSSKRATASGPHDARTLANPAASRSACVTVRCAGEIQEAMPVIGWGVDHTSP